MRKAVLKRIKITGTGKLIRRKQGHDHFNAKASRKTQLRKKGFHKLANPAMEKRLKRYI